MSNCAIFYIKSIFYINVLLHYVPIFSSLVFEIPRNVLLFDSSNLKLNEVSRRVQVLEIPRLITGSLELRFSSRSQDFFFNCIT